MSAVTELDVKGLSCPLPVLRAKKVLDGLDRGAILEVQATDPGSVKHFEAFCRQTGCRLLGWSETAGVYVFRLEKP
jgi:tRNA 2-thiouridine synthesizing protein A